MRTGRALDDGDEPTNRILVPMNLRPLALAITTALLIFPANARAQDDATPSTYSDDAIWNWNPHLDEIASMCGVDSSFELRPDEQVGDAGCVVAAMRALGASDSAVRFFETTGDFLVAYDRHGPVDFGLASSPWVNMGRGEAVLLNGAPSAILISKAVDGRKEAWATAPGYADLLSRYPDAFPWLEYGGPTSTETSPDGVQSVNAVFDMRECRACANVATLRIALRFDARGVLIGVDVLPPGPPRQ